MLKIKLSAAPFVLLLLFLGLSQNAQAQLTCSTFCSSVVPCDYHCFYNGNYQSNCMIYNGVCNRDPEGDGIDWAVDNCPTVSNANQANCDGDSKGNVCDDINGIFVPSGKKIACSSDVDDHGTYRTYEMEYQQRYVDTSSCSSADRWNITLEDNNCYGFCGGLDYEGCLSVCIEDATHECDDNICSPIGQDNCNPDTIP